MKVLDPKSISAANINVDSNFCISGRIFHFSIMTSLYKGKMPCIGFKTAPSCDLSNRYTHPSSFVTSHDDTFLYVAPECSTSRDALRQSGFKLVRDWEKSNIIVLPKIEVTYKAKYDVIIEFEKHLIIVNILNKDNFVIDDDKRVNLKNSLASNFTVGGDAPIHIWVHPNLESGYFYTVNRCEMYKQIYSDNPPSHSFCFENELRITPTLEINPELFKIWRACKDRSVLQCAVQQVDWQKYPTTLAWFLAHYQPYITINANSYLKQILDSIGFEAIRYDTECNREVSPEDWNMLQRCELEMLGLPEQGGFVDSGKSIPSCFRQKIAVKPIFISEPQKYSDLIQAAKN